MDLLDMYFQILIYLPWLLGTTKFLNIGEDCFALTIDRIDSHAIDVLMKLKLAIPFSQISDHREYAVKPVFEI